MRLYLQNYYFIAIGGAILCSIVFTGLFLNKNTKDSLNTTVTNGTVTETVSVSGYIEADKLAKLDFPQNGRVTGVFVDEGDEVEAGTLLATIADNGLMQQRQSAAAVLTKAIAARDELINGQTTEESNLTESTVAQAEANLEKTIIAEEAKVKQALATWQSSGLVAYSTNDEEDAPTPTVTGSYMCEEEGIYEIEAYGSGSYSGYSARFTGLEAGTMTITTDQPADLGDCGLQLQFSDGASYHRTNWIIEIPNTKSSTYLTRKTAYDLTVRQAEQNVQAARDSLAVAKATASRDTAAPRTEDLSAAYASVADAQANLAKIDAQLENYAIFAPFTGTITNVDLILGETASTEPIISILATDAFTLVARIPEIDITKISVGQKATAKFDANSEEIQGGTITFVSPVATEIEGVAYFTTDIILDMFPNWLRSGLSADIEITTNELTDVLRLPKRFIFFSADNNPFVYRLDKNKVIETPISIIAEGNDGYIALEGLTEGTTVTVPSSP